MPNRDRAKPHDSAPPTTRKKGKKGSESFIELYLSKRILYRNMLVRKILNDSAPFTRSMTPVLRSCQSRFAGLFRK